MSSRPVPLDMQHAARHALLWLGACVTLGLTTSVLAADATLVNPVMRARAPASVPEPPASAAEPAQGISIKGTVAQQLREAIERSSGTSLIRKKPPAEKKSTADAAPAAAHVPSMTGHTVPAQAKPKPASHRAASKPSAGHESTSTHEAHAAPHWSYEGETGPQAWGRLQPEFNLCAIGKRQSPIHIEATSALQGPAEPLQIRYVASKGSVVNNGHTIQVDLEGENTLTVRGSTYHLVQFHFHHPAEEKVNGQAFALVAHLVHKNTDGQLAVLAVLFDPGEANAMIHKVWTHMPLDVNDRVRLPDGLVDLNEALPQDRRYYQFIGSLTTPPCTEGVLWIVLKSPMTLGPDQLKVFAQQFPNNARPVQPTFGRVVREAQ